MNTPACTALQQFLLGELKQALSWQQALQKSRDPENVHQLRICLRKMRTALKLSKPILKRRYRQRWQTRLRDAAKQLDKARDLDVLLLSVSLQTPSEQAAQKQLQKQRNTTYKVLRSNLHRAPFSQWKKLEKQLNKPLWVKQRCRKRKLSLKQFASRQLEPIYQKIKQAYGQLNTLDDNALHRLRIHCKQLRYACEFVEPALKQPNSRRFLESLRCLQDQLGALHDAKVQQDLLASCPTPELDETVQTRTEQLKQEMTAELGRLMKLNTPWPSVRRK